ncbi:MAG TPA: radical SAM protein, partial [Gammaproteobacteria bacterium]|nr:radical SAM protein [Gammaproteobacteria bacterium]
GHCNLRCVFCQNWDISQKHQGRECSADEIADCMLALQAKGCHNINFVTPEHVAPQVVEAIAVAAPRGLNLPIVYNTSAYDAVRSLRLLDGLIDIYMPDFKFWTRESARRLAKAKDYPQRAREAIREMHRQVGPLRFGRDGLARRGLLVRHLVMPEQEEETAAILNWLSTELGADTYVNVMDQYRPEYQVGAASRSGRRQYVEIERRPHRRELVSARAAADRAGLWRLDRRW